MSANAPVRVTLDTPHGQAPSASHGESETQVAVDDVRGVSHLSE